ncbi:hypothetical protein [Halapricum desulfuricans]|uniref:Uncharacterized protein n=1 Tax=Halapricum desulfuricans TaxID=2841257 RepID=A0A897N0X3_9EURY|nr:hypothetical protein [Halapricum desulfuricans]QSG08000.1 hypothetical protein HSR122_0593 [Halapricum desulfuricans]
MTMTRRRVLAALVAVGGAGALTERTTGAVLRNREQGSLDLSVGLVDLVVEYWENPEDGVDRSNPDGIVDGQQLAVPITSLTADGRGRTVLRLSLPQDEGPNNPGSIWLRSDCPEKTTLAELLQVTVSYATADGTPTTEIERGSLRAVADALRGGRRIDGDPTTPEPDCLSDEVFLVVEYELGTFLGSETVSLPFSLVATQCRNADPGANPFPADAIDDRCRPAYSCDCCWTIGKVEVDARLQSGQTYAFDEGLAGYAVHVTDTDGDSDVAFELVTTDDDVPRLPLCDVAVKGGPPDVHYPRQDDTFGFDTNSLDGAIDGIVYAPENPDSGERYGISYLLVSVCSPTLADGTCPVPVATGAASVGGSKPPRGKPDTGLGAGKQEGDE